MRIILSVILLLFSCQSTSAADPASPVPDSIRIERLAGLCELWGVVKYFHPYLAYKDIDWDEALIKTIPKVNKAETADDYRRAIQYLISFLKDPNTYIVDEDYEFPRARISDLPDEEFYPAVVWTEDSIAIIVASDFKKVLARVYESEYGELTPRWYANSIASRARGIIIDARCLWGPTINMYDTSTVSNSLRSVFISSIYGFFSDTIPVPEPSARFRIYSNHIDPDYPWRWKESGFLNRIGYEWRPDKETLIDRLPVVFLINEGSADLLPMLGVIQNKKMGAIIFEGQFSRDGGIETYNVKLPEEVSVEVRLTEIVKSDGTEAVHPNIVIPYTTDTTLLECPPIRTAIDIINGRREIPPGVAQALPLVVPRVYERIYGNMPAPKLEYRLLALFKFWNEIKYFYPHYNQIKEPWDSVLRELVPVFESAAGERAYETAIQKMVSKAGIYPVFDNVYSCYPSISVDFVENQTVVINSGDIGSDSVSSIEAGDIVLSIDGVDIVEKRKRLEENFAAPSPQGMRYLINRLLLGSNRRSPIKIEVQKADGRVAEFEIPRSFRSSLSFKYSSDSISRQIDGESILYISNHVVNSLDSIMDADALILDLRQVNYWYRNIERIDSIFFKDEPIWCLTRKIARYSPDPDQYSWSYNTHKTSPHSEYYYPGKVAVLIDASTYGPAEEKCLYLKAANGITFIGMPTNGGPLCHTEINLPGNDHYDGTVIHYSCNDTRFPDDTPVYGVGIQPDIYVEPTIEGIRQGRDEILEAAIEYLEKELKK